jgi:hypothetical protein
MSSAEFKIPIKIESHEDIDNIIDTLHKCVKKMDGTILNASFEFMTPKRLKTDERNTDQRNTDNSKIFNLKRLKTNNSSNPFTKRESQEDEIQSQEDEIQSQENKLKYNNKCKKPPYEYLAADYKLRDNIRERFNNFSNKHLEKLKKILKIKYILKF